MRRCNGASGTKRIRGGLLILSCTCGAWMKCGTQIVMMVMVFVDFYFNLIALRKG